MNDDYMGAIPKLRYQALTTEVSRREIRKIFETIPDTEYASDEKEAILQDLFDCQKKETPTN